MTQKAMLETILPQKGCRTINAALHRDTGRKLDTYIQTARESSPTAVSAQTFSLLSQAN